ncbi:MAG: hypothetical protein ABI857_11130 [Acidobacteriota bacterium]
MKKQMLVISMVVLAVLLSVGGVAAQDDKKMKMEGMDMMAMMQKSPHHKMMMAHRQSVLAFAKALRDMASGGKLEDVELARNAFAEIKRGMEKMAEIQKDHMSKMDPKMMEKMKPMMEKMQAEKAAMKEDILALEKALQANAPDAKEVERHAAAIVERMEKMKMPEMKMGMPDKPKK